jgi:uncharacterized protein (TIGR00251 family)
MKRIDERADGALVFSVKLAPRSSKDSVAGWTATGDLRVYVTSPPVDDAANRRLVDLLSDTLDVPKSEVVITSGFKSRSKRLSVPAACKNRLLRFPDI